MVREIEYKGEGFCKKYNACNTEMIGSAIQ